MEMSEGDADGLVEFWTLLEGGPRLALHHAVRGCELVQAADNVLCVRSARLGGSV